MRLLVGLRHATLCLLRLRATPVSAVRVCLLGGSPRRVRSVLQQAPQRLLDPLRHTYMHYIDESILSYDLRAAAAPAPVAPIVADAASAVPQELMVLGEGLETPIQLIYLVTLLGFLAVGAYLVVRQVLIRRELDEGAKGLGERIRTGEATCEVRSPRAG